VLARSSRVLGGHCRLASHDCGPVSWTRASLATASAVLAVVLVGGFLVRGGDSSSNASTTAPSGYLVPEWLPEGLQLHQVTSGSGTEPRNTLAGEIVVYGDTRLADPWLGPILVLMRLDQGTWADSSEESTGDVDIDGVRHAIAEDDDATSVWPVEGGDDHVVAGYGLTSDAVIRAAEHLTTELVVGAEGVPEGYEEIARGPVGTAFGPASLQSGIVLVYGDGSEDGPELRIMQRGATGRDPASLLRLGEHESSPLSLQVEIGKVRGEPAYSTSLRNDVAVDPLTDGPTEPVPEVDPLLVQWFEPSLSSMVTVTTTDVDDADLSKVIDSLRIADPEEVDDLLADYVSASVE
jgi:hypothetical protein